MELFLHMPKTFAQYCMSLILLYSMMQIQFTGWMYHNPTLAFVNSYKINSTQFNTASMLL